MQKGKQYEVIIPIYWDQLSTVYWSIKYIRQNLNPSRILFIGPSAIREHLDLRDSDIDFMDGNLICEGMNKSNIEKTIQNILAKASMKTKKERAGWYLQQFIKMGYAYHAKEDGYIVWDGDSVPVQKIDLWDSVQQKKVMILGAEHHHIEYYHTMSRLFGEEIEPVRKETFVVPYMLFDTGIMLDMLNKISENVFLAGDTWWERILYAINPKDIEYSGFSEFETYGEFVNMYYENNYIFRKKVEQSINARILLGDNPREELLHWAGESYAVLIFEARDISSRFWNFVCNSLYQKVTYRSITEIEKKIKKISPNSIKERAKRVFFRLTKRGC